MTDFGGLFLENIKKISSSKKEHLSSFISSIFFRFFQFLKKAKVLIFVPHKRQQSHKTGFFDGGTELFLVFEADAGVKSALDGSVKRNVIRKQRGIFVVDFDDAVSAERTDEFFWFWGHFLKDGNYKSLAAFSITSSSFWSTRSLETFGEGAGAGGFASAFSAGVSAFSTGSESAFSAPFSF